MPEDYQPPTQEPPKRASSGHKLFSATGLGLLAVIFGVLLPPLGLVIAIFALYKAGQQSSRAAMILGILGIVGVISGTVLYVLAYNERYNSETSINSKTYTYDKFEDYKLPGPAAGRGLSFKKPTDFIYRHLPTNTGNMTTLTHQTKLPGYSSRTVVGSIDVAIAFPTEKINDAYLKKTSDAFDQQNKDYSTYKTGITNYLHTYVYPIDLDNLTLEAPKSFTSGNIKSNAWTINYTVSTTYEDGTVRNVNGIILYAVGKTDLYYFSISGLANNFKANASTWKTIFDSVKIDQ